MLGLLGVTAAVFLSALGGGLLAVAVAAAAVWINGLLAVANLIPGAGLDGGRIVRALAWARSGDSTRAGLVAARFSEVSGAILTTAGVTALALGHMAGLLVRADGRADDRGLPGRGQPGTHLSRAGRGPRPRHSPAGRRPRPTARGWQTVQAFLEDDGGDGLARIGATAYPVRDFDGQLSGLTTLTQLLAVPAERRDGTRLSQVATPVAYLAFTTLDEPLTELRARVSVGPASPAALHTAGHHPRPGPSGGGGEARLPWPTSPGAAQFGAWLVGHRRAGP